MIEKAITFFHETIIDSGQIELLEGVFDPHILKAIFMGGSGGSGKGFISGAMFSGTGLRVVNTDDAYELLMTKERLIRDGDGPLITKRAGGLRKITDPSPSWRFDVQMDPEHLSQKLRAPAKKLAKARQANFLNSRLGVILDSTATNASKIIKTAMMLNSLGYDIYMVFVNTSLETSIARNAGRRRTLPNELLRRDWAAAQKALPQYRAMFGPNYIEIDNNKMFGGSDPDTWRKKLVPRLQKAAAKFYNSPVKNPIGKAWIKQQLKERSDSAASKGRGRALKPSMRAPEREKFFFKEKGRD